MNDTTVEYRDIPGFPGYRVGSDGSVWSSWRGQGISRKPGPWRRLKSCLSHGYPTVHLFDGRGGHQPRVHQLVLLAFVGPCPPGLECCHENDVKTDNRLSNLRWDTRKSNAADRDLHGRQIKGSHHCHAKLTEEHALAIHLLHRLGFTLHSMSRAFGVSVGAIALLLRGRTWRHVLPVLERVLADLESLLRSTMPTQQETRS